MSDIETIKSRVAKLMAVAGDGVASANEIESAMRLAAKLLDAHHLKMDDCVAATGPADDEISMGDAEAVCGSSRMSTWESTLGHAVAALFGCVKWYQTHREAPIRVNGIAQMSGGNVRYGKCVVFYGPATEAREAAELFQEWSRSIATMGVARWGGCFRGDGGMYCYGFASAILAQVRIIADGRRLIEAKPLPVLPGEDRGDATAITLRDRYEILKGRAHEWLANDRGVKLGTSSRSTGYRSGSSGAYAEGRRHGSQAGFGRRESRKALL